MKSNAVFGTHFYGNEISDYGKECGYVDYATFAKSFDAVLSNDIMGTLATSGYYFEPVQGWNDNEDEIEELEEIRDILADRMVNSSEKAAKNVDNDLLYGFFDASESYYTEVVDSLETEIYNLENSDGNFPEVLQFYIVSDLGADTIKQWTNDPLYYCEELDMYIWGVTHFGTSWDYVLTDIRCNAKE